MKKLLFTCVFLLFLIFCCLNPKLTIEASKNGILIWFEQILPTLLPFTILSGILLKSNFLHSFKRGASGLAIFLIILCGLVFGFPIGAKLSCDFYKSNLLNKKQALLLSVAVNNFSPMYVFGFALPLLFPKENPYVRVGFIILYLLPITASLLYLLADAISLKKKALFATSKPLENHFQKELSVFQINMKTMDLSIINGFETLIKICGYIVLFSVIATLLTSLWNDPGFVGSLFLENLEITNGITLLAAGELPEKLCFICAIQILSLGGLSGMAQTASFLSEAKLSVYKYIIGKVILSLLLTIVAICYVI